MRAVPHCLAIASLFVVGCCDGDSTPSTSAATVQTSHNSGTTNPAPGAGKDPKKPDNATGQTKSTAAKGDAATNGGTNDPDVAVLLAQAKSTNCAALKGALEKQQSAAADYDEANKDADDARMAKAKANGDAKVANEGWESAMARLAQARSRREQALDRVKNLRNRVQPSAPVTSAAPAEYASSSSDPMAGDDEVKFAEDDLHHANESYKQAKQEESDARAEKRRAENAAASARDALKQASSRVTNAKQTKEAADVEAAAQLQVDAFAARLNAVDSIGLLASQSTDGTMIAPLTTLLQWAPQQPTELERTLFALHVVRAVGSAGTNAKQLVPDLNALIKINPILISSVTQAQHDITVKPAANPTPPASKCSAPTPDSTDALTQAQSQLADMEKSVDAMNTATASLKKSIETLSETIKKLVPAANTSTPPK